MVGEKLIKKIAQDCGSEIITVLEKIYLMQLVINV